MNTINVAGGAAAGAPSGVMLSGAQIKLCRTLCGLSQQALADLVNVHRTTIARAELAGDAIPDDFTSGNMWRVVREFEARGCVFSLDGKLSAGLRISHPKLADKPLPPGGPGVRLKKESGNG